MFLSKTLYPPFSTSSTQESSQHNDNVTKNVDKDCPTLGIKSNKQVDRVWFRPGNCLNMTGKLLK